MADGDLTLGIPGGGASDFTTAALPSVVLFRSAPGEPLTSRSQLGYAGVTARSNRGAAAISGPAYAPTYIWAVASMVTQTEAQQIAALAGWQDRAYKARANGALRLLDETEYLDPEPTPHSRPLLASLTPSWASGYRYGYGVFAVKLQLPEDWRQQVGVWATGEQARLVTFSLVEL